MSEKLGVEFFYSYAIIESYIIKSENFMIRSDIESQRLREIERLSSYDDATKIKIDEIINLITEYFEVEVCLLSFIDSETQHIKFNSGFSNSKISLENSLCFSAVEKDDVFVIENLSENNDYTKSPFYHLDLKHRNFVSVSIVANNGAKVGALSLLGFKGEITKSIKKMIKNFGKQIIDNLELCAEKNKTTEITKYFNEIQAISQTGRWELDLLTSKTVWSSEVYNIYKIPIGEELDKKDGLSYYSIEDQKKLSDMIDESVSMKTSFDGEFQFIDNEGTKKWVRSRGYPVFDSNGNLIKITGTIQDISNQKESQLELQRYSRDLEVYVKTLNSYALLSKTDLDGNITFVNELFCSRSGYQLNELLGQNHRILSSGFHKKEFFEDLWSTINLGHQWRGEIKNISKSGEAYWVDTIITPVFGDNGKIVEFFSFRLDITERKTLHEKILNSDYEKRLFFDQSFDAIMSLRPPEWKFTAANSATLKLFNVPKDVDFTTLGPWDISPEFQSDGTPSADKAKLMIQTAIENGSHNFQWRHCKLNGTEMECNVLLSKVTEGDNFYLNATVRDISVEKKIHLQLIEAQAISKIGSWTFDVRTNELTWSLEHYKIFEIDYPKPSDELYKLYRERIHPEDLEKLDHLVESSVNFGENFVFDHRVLLLGNRIKYVQGIGKVVRDSNGKTILINGTCRDRSEDVERELDYRNLMESISEGIIIQDETGAVVDFNQSSLDIFELSAHQLIGKSSLNSKWRIINQKGHEVDVKNHPGLVTIRTGKPIINLILGLKFTDGKIKWICVNTNPIKNSLGTRVISTVSDITELIAAKEENKFVLDSIGIGIWKYRLDTKELKWDSSMYKLFNIHEDDFSGDYQAWESSLTPESKEIAVKALNDAIAGIRDFDITFEIQASRSEKRSIGGKAKVIRDKNGIAQIVYGINWDRTKEIELEKNLNAERSKSFQNARLASIGQLAAGVGHEINNPLAIISGHISIVKEDLKDPEVNREKVITRLNKIDNSIDRIANIVNTLRNFARSDEGQLTKFDPYLLAEETKETLFELYSKENTSITIVGEHKRRSIFGNKNRMQQVFINLLNNAKDAMTDLDLKPITLEVTYLGDKIKITISDIGSGIPDDLKEKIFTPFFTTKQVNKGTGIGLSLVSAIVREHNGVLDIESTIGKGSSFSVTLPVYSSNEDEIDSKTEVVEKFEAIDCRVLIVDDEEELREIGKVYFSKYCSHVTVADSARAGLGLLEKHDFDLVISDIKMPEIDGFEFYKLLTRNENTRGMKFAFMSGGVSFSKEALDLIEKNSITVLSKPINETEIKDLLIKLSDRNH